MPGVLRRFFALFACLGCMSLSAVFSIPDAPAQASCPRDHEASAPATDVSPTEEVPFQGLSTVEGQRIRLTGYLSKDSEGWWLNNRPLGASEEAPDEGSRVYLHDQPDSKLVALGPDRRVTVEGTLKATGCASGELTLYKLEEFCIVADLDGVDTRDITPKVAVYVFMGVLIVAALLWWTRPQEG